MDSTTQKSAPLFPSGEIPGNMLRFSHQAMATRFEIFILHKDAGYAGEAAHEAFRELDRLEQELSRFIDNSDVARINHTPPGLIVRTGLETFDCLKKSLQLGEMTGWAFDITAGSLYNKGPDFPPSSTVLRIPPQSRIALDETSYQVRRSSKSVVVDLGGIGKGFALDHMAGLLRDWDIGSALIHGGSSTALALAEPPGEPGWLLSVSLPYPPYRVIETIRLKQRALSGSGVQKGFHIFDPRTGKCAESCIAAWAQAPDGATADALSTAFMVMAPQEIEALCQKYPSIGTMVIPAGEERMVKKYGNWEA
jgi:thiamine biosynthesis lipoprotein